MNNNKIENQNKRDLIIDRIDIVKEIGQDTEIKSNGDAPCPLLSHGSSDTHPSFHVYADTQSWYCFKEGIGGSIFDFNIHYKNQTFKQAFEELATKAGVPLDTFTPEEKKQIEDERTIEDILEDTTAYYASIISEEAKKYVTGTRKLTEEFMKECRIGYANGGLKNYLLNDKGYSLDLCINAGVLYQKLYEDGTVTTRDYFYKNAIILPHIVYGKVRKISCRVLDGSEPKYIHTSGEIKYLLGQENLAQKRVFIVEGFFDYLMAKMRGIPAVALIGVHLKEEHIEKFSRCEEVILTLDPDKAGADAILKVGQQLGQRAKVFLLPKGQDPDQYIFTHDDQSIEEDVADLPFFYNYWIGLINEKTDKKELPKKLEPILRRLSFEEEIYWEEYLNDMKERFELTPKAKSAYGKQIVKFRDEGIAKAKKEQEKQRAKNFGLANEPKPIDYLFHPALTIDRKNQRILVGIPKQIPSFINGKVEYEERLTMLCNTGEKWELVEEEVEKRGWYPASTPSFGLGRTRCSETFIASLSKIPTCDHGDQCYQQKQNLNNPYTNIFLPIRNTFEHFLEFSNPAYSTVVTLWTIGTYLFVIFPAFPYLHPNGFKESGKTKLSEIIARLGFNAESASNSSASALFRTIDANLPTFLLDEAEQLTGFENNPDLRLIFNAGYKANNPVRRTNPNTFKVESFNIYSPKVILSINPLERTLASRCIPIIMLRTANKEIGKRKVTDNATDWQKLRDSLYTFLFHHALCVAEIYDNPSYLSTLNNRDEELYSPLFALAHYIDSYVPSDEQKLLPLVDQFASETIQEEEGLDDWSLWILEAIDDLVDDFRPYLVKDIRTKMSANRIAAGELLDDRLSNRVIGTTLRKFGFRRGKSQREGKTYLLKREEIENLKSRFTQTPEIDGNKSHDGNISNQNYVQQLDIKQSDNQVSETQQSLFINNHTVDISIFVQALRELEDKNIIGLLPAFKKIAEYENDEIPVYLEALYDLLDNEKVENKNLYRKIAELLESEALDRNLEISFQQKPPKNERSEIS